MKQIPMLHVSFSDANPVLIGATRGEAWLEKNVLSRLDPKIQDALIICIDFKAVEAANASFIKASVLRLMQIGMQFHQLQDANSQTAPPGVFDIFPVVFNCGEEVRLELHEVMIAQRLPLAMAAGTVDQVVLGWLDPSLRDTWHLVLNKGGAASATDLVSTTTAIGHTAWANRLSELHRLRLVVRKRDGKKWKYTLTTTEVHQHG